MRFIAYRMMLDNFTGGFDDWTPPYDFDVQKYVTAGPFCSVQLVNHLGPERLQRMAAVEAGLVEEDKAKLGMEKTPSKKMKVWSTIRRKVKVCPVKE